MRHRNGCHLPFHLGRDARLAEQAEPVRQWYSGRACVKEGAEVAGGNMRRERKYGFAVPNLVMLLASFALVAAQFNVAPV